MLSVLVTRNPHSAIATMPTGAATRAVLPWSSLPERIGRSSSLYETIASPIVIAACTRTSAVPCIPVRSGVSQRMIGQW